MTVRAKDLAERLRVFNGEVISFVENCTEEDWRKVCAWEEWTVGVIARHIGAGHFSVIEWVKMIIDGQKLPELTGEQITEMANQHAREHADCTKAEVLDILRKHGEAFAGYVADLDDTELDRAGYLTMADREVSAQQIIENVILHSGGKHFANMRAATSA
jgi:hypothetical protein